MYGQTLSAEKAVLFSENHHHRRDRDATEVRKVYRLAEVARERLQYVYTGNC